MAQGENAITPNTATSWHGAPPTAEGGFAFANGDFYVEVSGQKRHRRATIGELKEHFCSGSNQDHPAHWFEAQLAHYGLKRSKTKSVARMRLFDALQAGNLTVPAHLSKLEAKLRKEWTKKDRAARKAHKADKGDTAVASQKPTRSKRKATNSAASIAEGGCLIPCGKKARTASARHTSPRAPSSPRVSTRNTAASKAATSNVRGLGNSRGKMRDQSSIASFLERAQDHGRKRKSKGPHRDMTAHSQTKSLRKLSVDLDTAKDVGVNDNDEDSLLCSMDEHDEETYGRGVPLSPLLYINGRYAIDCPHVTDNWPQYGRPTYHLVLTLSTPSLWAAFNLGLVEGVMYFSDIPKQSSRDRIPFKWRGRIAEDGIMYGDQNKGWLRFLGGGRIEGQIDYQNLAFSGWRRPGPATATPIDSNSVQNMWLGYSEEENKQLSRTRWQ